jgi:hypothetical protein
MRSAATGGRPRVIAIICNFGVNFQKKIDRYIGMIDRTYSKAPK